MDKKNKIAHLFKYYSVTTLNLNTIKDNSIYLTHPELFNDPFDSIINAKANDEEILKDISDFLTDQKYEYCDFETLKIAWGPWLNENPESATIPYFTDSLKHFAQDFPGAIEKYRDRVLNRKSKMFNQLRRYLRITKNLGICSFSTIYNSESMWAYYANNHKGICVEYEVDKKKIKGSLLIEEVEYIDLDEYVEMKKTTDGKLIVRSKFKKKCWGNENEVRLIHSKLTNTQLNFPGEIISITFGAFTPKHDIRIIINVLGKKIRYYRMNVVYGSKKIVRSEMSSFYISSKY